MGKELKRINYLTGLLLEAEDYSQDKEYQRRQNGLHSRYLHTWGIISGLDVKPVTDSNMEVYVTEGAAIDLSTEGLYGTKVEESISRQILIYEGHPDNPIDLSEYSAGDNIYIFASCLECGADRDYERGQGEEIHIWECGHLSFAKEKPEDNKNNIILARIVPKKVVKKNLDADYSETIIDNTCIYYTDTDGSELRVYAGATARELALKIFKFKLEDKINGMPYITTNLEKLTVKELIPGEQYNPKEDLPPITDEEAAGKLEIIKSGLDKCIESIITPDQNELKAALDSDKLDYVVNLTGCNQLLYLLKIVFSDLQSFTDKQDFLDEFNKSIEDFRNIVINMDKTDRNKLADQLNQFSDDFEKLIYNENSTDCDQLVGELELVRSDIDKCLETIEDIDTEKLRDMLEEIQSDLIKLKDNVDETGQVRGRLTESTDRLIAFISIQKTLADSIEAIKAVLGSASELTGQDALNKLDDGIKKLASSVENLVTSDQKNLIKALESIISGLESLKKNIGQVDIKGELVKIENDLSNLVTYNTEQIKDELKKITIVIADLKNSIDINDQKEILFNIDLIAYSLRKCTDNAVTIYQKGLATVLNLINDDLSVLKAEQKKFNKIEFISNVSKIIDRLQKLIYTQNDSYMTDIDTMIASLGNDVSAQAEKIKTDLSSLIGNVSDAGKSMLNSAISDAVKSINKIQTHDQTSANITIADLINSLEMFNTENQQSVIYLLKKSMSDLSDIVCNPDDTNYSKNSTEMLDKIRADLDESIKNANSTDQSKFISKLEEFRQSVTQLKESNRREFANSVKVIYEGLKGIISMPEAEVINKSDMAYLENNLDIVDVFAIGKVIRSKLNDISNSLETIEIDDDNKKKRLYDLKLKFSYYLPYMQDKIDKSDLIYTLEEVKGYFEKCTEAEIIVDREKLSEVLRKFKCDFVYLRNDKEDLVNSLKTMTNGLSGFINEVNFASEDRLVDKLQNELADLINLIKSIAAEDFKNQAKIDLEQMKSTIDESLKKATTVQKEKFIAVLEKIKAYFGYLNAKTDPKKLVDFVKLFASSIVNFIIDLADAGSGDLAVTSKKSLSGTIELINEVKSGDVENERLCKFNRIRQDLFKCKESIITSEQNELITELGAFKTELEQFKDNLNTTSPNELLTLINKIADYILKFVNDENRISWESLSDAMSIVAIDLVNLTNELNTSKDKEVLLNTLLISADVVNFSGDVIISNDLDFKQLVAKQKNGKIQSEVKLTDKYLQLNSQDNDTKDSWKLRDGGIEVFRGGPGIAPDARIVWSETEKIWKAGFENKLSPILYGDKWNELIEGVFNDELHLHSKLSVKKGTVLSVNDDGCISSEKDLVLNNKDLQLKNGKLEWYGYEKLFGTLEVNGPVMGVTNQGLLGSASNGEIAALLWNKDGKVGIGSADPGITDAMEIAGSGRLLVGSNPLRITSEWTGFPDLTVNQAEISNDTTYYKALMIVGNQSAGQGRKVAVSDMLEVNGLLNVNGYMQMRDKLVVSAGSGNNGIVFPSDPGGGSGDAAWVKYYPRTGESCTLEIGTSNDGDDNILFASSGSVGVGTIIPNDKLDVKGNMRILSGMNPLRFTDLWSEFTSGSPANAEISNDTNAYRALMIVGNRSGGNQRIVSVWDDLDVNGPLEVKGNGNLQVRGAIVPGVGNCEVKGIMFQKDPGGGSGDAAWIRYYSDESRGGGENMTLEIGVSNDSNVQTDYITEWISTCPYGITNGCGYWNSYTRTYVGDGGDRLRFRTSNGGTYIDGNFYLVSSKEYKENINNVSKAAVRRIIDELEPVEYNFKRDKSRTTLGFIAESMPKKLTNSDKKAISPIEIMTVLVGEVKEQEKEISDLRKKVAKLKRRKK
jgi:hypothetical protein